MTTLVLLVQAVTVATALYYASEQAQRRAMEALEVAGAVADSFLQARKEQLATSVAVLARDFALRQAVATGDGPTAESALSNHAMRIQAHQAMLLDPGGGVIASVGHPIMLAPEVWQDILTAPGRLVVLGDQRGELYQIELAPMRAPDLVGWVTMGFGIDADLADQLEKVTGTGVLFRAQDNAAQRAPTMRYETDRDYAFDLDLGTTGTALTLHLWTPKLTALEDFFDLRNTALAISAAAVLLALGFALVMSRRLTARLSQLAGFAAQIAQGEYPRTQALVERDMGSAEVTQLAATLHAMQEGIVRREDQIRYQASHDKLTNLLTHDAALVALQEVLDDATRGVTVVVLAIRGLQDLNSSVGLEMGDAAVRYVAERIGTAGFILAARLSDTRFMVVVEHQDRVALSTEIDMLSERLERVQISPEVYVRFDLYFGATWASAGDDAQEKVRHAWTASIEAMNRLESLAWHNLDDSRLQQRRLTIMRDLRGAMIDDQFHLVFQPKFHTPSSRYTGAEALLRWDHPVLGPVPVDEFIAIAEQTQDIRRVSRWVLRRALWQVAAWRQTIPDLQISVNVTAHDLTDREFAPFVKDVLSGHQVPGAALQLEVTERALVHDWSRAQRTLAQLESLDVSLAIDDYGIGFSSLAQLKELPARVLKIDKSFVMSLDQCPNDQHIVRSTIELAHALNLQVVAEGVETAEAMHKLTGWGCDYLQGYYLSRPVGAAELPDIISTRPRGGGTVAAIQR